MAKSAATSFQFLVSLPAEIAHSLDALAKETGVPRLTLVRRAVNHLLMEHGGEKLSVELPDDLRVDLAALQEALDGASAQRMIERAVRDYVDRVIDHNPGIRGRFEESRKQVAARGGRVIEFRDTRMS